MSFEVVRIEPLRLDGPDELLSRQLMSPYVWRARDGRLLMLARAVPEPGSSDPLTGRIWLAEGSDDGLSFRADSGPLITPGPAALDIGGCEDPTVVPTEQGCVVYYTGIDANGDGRMLYASGPDIRQLEKRGVALASSKTERHTKEATVERAKAGEWRLFYEYAHAGRSLVGLAVGSGPNGPWQEQDDPFSTRPGAWDRCHLSTGPLLMTDPKAPVMFYNGADKDADWGIGWVMFDEDCRRVVSRGDKPLIAPPAPSGGGLDIAFATSALEEGDRIWLYFSRNDRSLQRALIRRSE